MEKEEEEHSQIAGVAASCIFGDSLNILPGGGASLLNVYNKSKETTTRYGWGLFAADQNFTVAELMALGYRDKDINKNSQYVYFITLNIDPSEYQEQGVTKVISDPPVSLPKPQSITYDPKDHGALVANNGDTDPPKTVQSDPPKTEQSDPPKTAQSDPPFGCRI
jgi:hypothetical protein